MPFPVAAAVAAGASVLSSGINAGVQGKMNRKSRIFAEKMAQMQQDRNVANWNMENAYNSPREQMNRFKEAGLNPHLMYGNGADAQGGRIANTEQPNWNLRAPEVDLGSAVMGYIDTRLKEAQIDLVQEQKKVAFQESLFKESQTAQTLANTDATKFDLGQRMRLKDISAQAAEANLARVQADTKFTLDQNERAAIAQTQNLAESVQRIANMRVDQLKSQAQTAEVRKQIQEIESRIKNIDKDTEIKAEDLKLKKQGIQPHDALWQRQVMEWINKIVGNAIPRSPGQSQGNFDPVTRKPRYTATDSQ